MNNQRGGFADEQNQNQKYLVTLRGQEEGKYCDIALTSLFSSHMAQINSERSVIWQRYNAMLVANSVVFGFLAEMSSKLKQPEMIIATFLGVALCALWLSITHSGYSHFNMMEDIARRFEWQGFENPIEIGFKYEKQSLEQLKQSRFFFIRWLVNKSKGGWIYLTAMFVILWFALGYLLLLLKALLIL